MKNKIIIAFLMFYAAFGVSQSCNLASEGFENGGSEPAGWVRSGAYTNGTLQPNTGTYHAGFNNEGGQLISPTYACPSQICFYWRTSGLSSDFLIDIQWSDDNQSTWNTLLTINVQDTASRTTYRQKCIDLNSIIFTNPNQVQFRFLQYNRTGGTWFLDDVCISGGGATKLSFISTPQGCTPINTNFSTEVCATDDCGNIDNTYIGNISISKHTGTGDLIGTLTQATSSGCASFTDLQLDTEDSYSLIANEGVLTNDTSSIIEIKADCPLTDTLTIMVYNLLNFPNGRDDCGTNTTIVNRIDTLKRILKYINPDILMVCELQDELGADLILNNALNTNGVTYYERAAFVPNRSSGFKGLNNMFFFNVQKVSFYSQNEIITNTRDVGEYIVYANDPNLATHFDTTFIDFYDCHLKAGSALADIDTRAQNADSIRKFIDAKMPDRNNIIGGDFNFYDAAEAGYQTLCYTGTYPFFDPISTEGAWNNNSVFAPAHTQSTRSTQSIECGALGGMDDRFDMILTSENIISGINRVQYIPNSYDNFGNDGSVFNQDINDPSNTTGLPDSILNALYYMSDHLPILMKVAITYPQDTSTLEYRSSNDKNEVINNNDMPNFMCYPNPAQTQLNFSFYNIDGVHKFEIKLHNLLGVEKHTIRIDENTKNQEIDISILPKGLYIVSLVKNGYSISTQKLLIK